ncbi:MAG TPA: hypothetical protein VGC54_12045 [Planctomycetota bacterium]
MPAAAAPYAAAFPREALEMLELPQTLDWLAEHAGTPMGRRLLLAARPGLSRTDLVGREERGREALQLVAAAAAPTVRRCPDLEELAERCQRRVLDASELLELADGLDVAQGLRRWAARAAAPKLAAMAAQLPDLSGLRAEIRRVVDERGRVHDDADPGLAQARTKIQELLRRRERVLEVAIESWSKRGILQQRRPVIRGERPTLAVRAVHQGRARGLLHDRSQSGDTVFIEPEDSVSISNDLTRERSREQQIVHRVLAETSRKVAGEKTALLEAGERIADLDLALACAAWAHANDGRWAELAESGIDLRDARHPLLERTHGRAGVVPLTLELGHDWDLLVVTGPNTGGKTVALKTLGLLAALAGAGLPGTFAEGTRIAHLPGIESDIGDPQSIEGSLSTFSGHLYRTLGILERAQAGCLVLLDEVGTGTDPEEGAALGQSILEALLARGALVVATTHLGSLKLFSLDVDRAENASMEFDPVSLEPRYRLLVGVPGASHALEVAQRLGLPADLLERARALSPRGGGTERLIADVARVRRDAELIRERARQSEAEARGAQDRMEAAERETEASRELRLAEAEMAFRNLREELAELHVRLGGKLRGRLRGTDLVILERLLAEAAACMRESGLAERWEAFLRDVRKGSVVYVPSLRERLQVLKVDRKRERVKLRRGALDVELPLHRLSWVEPPPSEDPA